MSKQTVTLKSGTVVELEAKYGYKTVAGQDIEDSKQIVELAKAIKDGKVIGEGGRYWVKTTIAPDQRQTVLDALDACVDELTGTTKAERMATEAKHDTMMRDYDKSHAAVEHAQKYGY